MNSLDNITILVPRVAANIVADAIEKKLEMLEIRYQEFGFSQDLADQHSQLMNIFLQLMEL